MIPLLDTHQHLLYRHHLDYRWSNELPPLAGQDFTMEDYQSLTRDMGVEGTLFMEVDADNHQEETRLVNSLAQDPSNKVLGMIASCRPEVANGFDAWLEQCAEMKVVGYRRILHEITDDLSKSDVFRSNIRKIGRQGKTFDMCFRADQLAIAYDLANACSDMTLVLDHCGVPDIGGGGYEPWSQSISKLSTLPHITCKMSGVLAYCHPKPANKKSISPYINHVIECFGPDRLVWGSDWPVVNLGSNLQNWIETFRDIILPLSTEEQTSICHQNAERIYKVSL